MRVLVTSFLIQSGSGAELFLRDLCQSLQNHNITVSCFGVYLGPLANQLRSSGVEVVSNLSDLENPPDIIHGHHNLATITALNIFPNAKGIYLCHDAKAWHDKAIFHPRIVRYVAVDKLCQRRISQDLNMDVSKIPVIGNGVNLDNFLPRQNSLPPKPKKALVFSNYAAEHNFLPTIRNVCHSQQIELSVIGNGSGNFHAEPQNELGKYDLVFAKARCAMEAMASGAAVILCDSEGLGPMVTAEKFDHLRDWNFGRATLTDTITEESILRQMECYDSLEAEEVSRIARKRLDWNKIVERWLELYREIIAEPMPKSSHQVEALSVENLIKALSDPLYSLYEKESVIQQLKNENERLRNRPLLRRVKNYFRKLAGRKRKR